MSRQLLCLLFRFRLFLHSLFYFQTQEKKPNRLFHQAQDPTSYTILVCSFVSLSNVSYRQIEQAKYSLFFDVQYLSHVLSSKIRPLCNPALKEEVTKGRGAKDIIVYLNVEENRRVVKEDER